MTQSSAPSVDSIEVSVGFETHPEGAASLTVSGNGDVFVTTKRLQESKSYDGKIEADAAARLIADTSSVQGSLTAAKRPGIPDEARYTIRVRRGGREALSVEAWEGELESSPMAKKLLDDLRGLAARVSEGEAFL